MMGDSPLASEPMTWAEICRRYPEEWVALVEIDWINDRDFAFRSARVSGHGATRRAPMVRPRWDWYPSIGHFFTGVQRHVPVTAEANVAAER